MSIVNLWNSYEFAISAFRDDSPHTVADIDIAFLRHQYSFTLAGLELTLTSVLNSIMSDSKIGGYDVNPTGSVFIGTPAIGRCK